MKKANLITVVLLIYLAVMAVLGWERFPAEGNYLEYFGLIGVTLLIVVLLRFVLIRKARRQQEFRKRRDASDRRCRRDDQIR